MFKETVIFKPKLDPADLKSMERTLASRFSGIAKKFGKGMVNALKGGGIVGIATTVIDKLLNPLQETQESIDRVLRQGDDIVTNAKQFGTTAGKLFRLQLLAKSTGLDEGNLDMLINKFQTAVAEAIADPNKQTAVRQFTGEKDTAEAFFQFIQSMQKLTKTQQLVVQQEVFGEKQILKMADFLQTDFAAQSKLLGGPTAEQLTPRLNNLANLNDRKDLLGAKREEMDVFKKGALINEQMVNLQDAAAKRELERENAQIKSYESLANLSAASNEIIDLGKNLLLTATSALTKLTDMAENVKAVSKSRWVKGIMKTLGGD